MIIIFNQLFTFNDLLLKPTLGGPITGSPTKPGPHSVSAAVRKQTGGATMRP